MIHTSVTFFSYGLPLLILLAYLLSLGICGPGRLYGRQKIKK